MEAIQSKKSVSLPDKDNKTFEVYFKPNEHDQYVLNPGNDLKKAGEEDDHILQAGEEIKLPDFQYDGNDPVEKLVYATEIEKFSRPERGFTVIASKIFGSYEESGMLKVFVTTSAQPTGFMATCWISKAAESFPLQLLTGRTAMVITGLKNMNRREMARTLCRLSGNSARCRCQERR